MAASLRLSQEGIQRVELARRKKGWEADAASWYQEAHSSKMTLKRFRAGEAIQQETFIALCKAVGIENWEEMVDESPKLLDSHNEIETWQRERFYGQFIGRSQELQELLKYLESEENNKVLGIVGIVGIGGLGKSALCHQLVLRAYEAKLFPKIVWVKAKIYQYQTDTLVQCKSLRDSRLTLDDALRDIGQELKLPNWILQDTKRCQSQISQILNTTPHLIVIDGLEDAESPKELATELRGFLGGKSCLILTSRKSTDTDILEYKLNKLSRETSREFIEVVAQEKYANSQNPLLLATEAEIQAILNITDGMPLAMKLLISLLKSLELDRIIERLENVSKEQDLYNYLFEDSWQELQRGNAIKAQKLLISLSSRSKPIPIQLLYGLVKGLSKEDVDECLQKLVKLSLVDISPGLRDKQVSLHSFTARYFWEALRSQYEQKKENNA